MKSILAFALIQRVCGHEICGRLRRPLLNEAAIPDQKQQFADLSSDFGIYGEKEILSTIALIPSETLCGNQIRINPKFQSQKKLSHSMLNGVCPCRTTIAIAVQLQPCFTGHTVCSASLAC